MSPVVVGHNGNGSQPLAEPGFQTVHGYPVHIVKYTHMPAVGHFAGKADILKGQSVNMLRKETVSRKDSPVAGLRVHFGKLRHVVGVILPAAVFRIPVRPGQQSLVFQEEGIYQPGETLHMLFRMELGIFPFRIQLALFRRMFHGESASVFHGNIFQGDIFYMGIRQSHQKHRIAGVGICDSDVTNQNI